MRTLLVLFIAIILSLSTQAQTTLSYNESFNDPSAFDGWLIPNPEGEIDISGGSLNLTYSGDGTEIWLVPPIAASKGDYYFRVVGSGDDMEGAGMYRKSETGSTVCYIVDDSIYIGYEYNSGDFNLMLADSLPGIEEMTSMGIGVTGTLPNLTLDVYINDEIFYSGNIPDAGPELNEGKIGYIVFGDTISLHLSDVSIEYNSIIDNPGEYYEPFDLEYGSWFYNNNTGIAIWREDGKLNIQRKENSISSTFLFAPVGAVKDFTFEIGGGGYINEGGGYIFRLYDFQHYTVVMMMDDELSIVYSDGFPSDSVKTLFESPLNINFDETNIKFEMEGEAPNIDVRLWLSDSSVYSGTMTGVSSKMSVGNLGFSLEGDTIIAQYDFVNILYEPMVTSLKEEAKDDIISQYKLYQNYPNPFNPTTKIKYSISNVGTTRELSLQTVTLKVYDILGNEVKTLVNENQAPGYYEIEFDGRGLSSGVYFYQITAGRYYDVKKMIILK